MAESTISSLMYPIIIYKEELYNRASSILGVPRTAFLEMIIRIPQSPHAELAFYQTVAWLYGLYYEAGRVSLAFLVERFSTYRLDKEENHEHHFDCLRYLRTYLQHNLNFDSKHDRDTWERCEQWFFKGCGSSMPGADEEWNRCLNRILVESGAFLSTAIECVRAIERDDSLNGIIEQWLLRLRRYHPKHEFELLVGIVTHDLGQDSLDPKHITERYYDKWSRDLRFRSADYVFEDEARRLIEHTILSEAEMPLPVSGKDIMSSFGIPPGPTVGRLLRRARTLYDDSPCNKDQLICRLKASVENI